MKKRYLNIIVILLFIGATIGSSYFVLDLSASAKNSHLITHEFNLIAGCSTCFQDDLQNNEGMPITITDIKHTGSPDIEGITITLYEAVLDNGDYKKGELLEPPFTVSDGETLHFYICYNTDIALKPDTYVLETQFIKEEEDNEPPTVEITKPLKKSLYIGNHRICSWWFTMIVCGIDIEVDASDGESGMNRVEFYINDALKETDTTEPYSGAWAENAFGKRIIRVTAYDNAGNSASDEITVWKFF